jgi:hypothetical protein
MSGTIAIPAGTPPGGDELPDLRAAAREYDAAGLSVITVRTDGSKAPDRSWRTYIERRSTPDEHTAWFDPNRRGGARTGIGVVFGAVSGNVEMLEFEGRAIAEGYLDKVTEIAEASGLGELWKQVANGWVRQSPSGGLHFHLRVEGAPVKGNTKLAARPARDDELTPSQVAQFVKNPRKVFPAVLIETRGEGGFAVVEPSHGLVHPTGKPYTRVTGSPATIPTISAEYYAALHALMRAVDEMPAKDAPTSAPRDMRAPLPGGLLRPGEDYENKTDWSDILPPLGWMFVYQHGRTRYWCRPGKDRGISATTGHAADRDRLFVFSTSTEFEAETAYTKFGAYALLHHGGDFKAATRELARRGYGDKPPHRPLDSNVIPLRPRDAPPPTAGANALHAAAEPPAVPSELPRSEKPAIDITNEAEGIQAIVGAMAKGQFPDLYKRAGAPCWVGEDEEGHPTINALASENLRAYLQENALTYAVVEDKETAGTREVWTLPHPRTCATILGRRDWPLPRLRGIVTSPVIRPDGTLLAEPGYDEPTGLFLHPRSTLRRLSQRVTGEAVTRAKAIVLDQMLADFPWQDPKVDRANYLGMLLTPILRHYFHGPTPMLVITANDQGSGKTLLKDIFGYCYGISSPTWSQSEEELRKSITAQLHTKGQPVVVFDNLPNGFVINSATLSNLLTGEYWGDRLLGASTSVQVRNDRVWILTGNSLKTGGDNERRTVWARLWVDEPDADQRGGFTVGPLRPWLRSNASTVVAALVTMVRAWLADGAKIVEVRKGDYGEWASIVAGVLDYLEVPGWLAGRGDSRDAEKQIWGRLFVTWREKFADQGVTSGAALAALIDLAPPSRAKRGEIPSKQEFGQMLSAHQDRYIGNYRLTSNYDSHAKQNLWCVSEYQKPGEAGS